MMLGVCSALLLLLRCIALPQPTDGGADPEQQLRITTRTLPALPPSSPVRPSRGLKNDDANATRNLHFGFYDDEPCYLGHTPGPCDTANSPATNFQPWLMNATEAVLSKALGKPGLLYVGGALWGKRVVNCTLGKATCGIRLKPTWHADWTALAEVARPLLANGSIIGFNLGDELCWNCLRPDELETAANAIRASFPRGSAILWYNEATKPVSSRGQWLADGCPRGGGTYRIPAALDWFSVDLYHMDGLVKGWVEANVKQFYEAYIFPNLTAAQRGFLVPGSFGSTLNKLCNKDCYDRMCAHDAVDFYHWAANDSRIVGLAPWNWGGCGGPCDAPKDEIGTQDMPLARAAWRKIGLAIQAASASTAT